MAFSQVPQTSEDQGFWTHLEPVTILYTILSYSIGLECRMATLNNVNIGNGLFVLQHQIPI